MRDNPCVISQQNPPTGNIFNYKKHCNSFITIIHKADRDY